MMKRSVTVSEAQNDALAAVIGERRYQDETYAGYPEPVMGEDILLIEEYAQRARRMLLDRSVPRRNVQAAFRKIAALAVRALENGGAPQREGYEIE